MKINHYIYIFILCVLTVCCTNSDNPKNDAEKTALAFSNAYFNYDFKNATKYVTDSSVKLLNYAASNITQEDVDILRSMEESATIIVDSSRINDNAVVYLTVHNFMQKDSIGKKSHITETGHFQINVVNDGKWKVKLESLPKNTTKTYK